MVGPVHALPPSLASSAREHSFTAAFVPVRAAGCSVATQGSRRERQVAKAMRTYSLWGGLLWAVLAATVSAGQAKVGEIINPGFEADTNKDGMPDG